MSASVYAVIANGQRVSDHDTRETAEAQAAATGGTVRLLDRRAVVQPEAKRVSCGCCSNGCVCRHHQDTPHGRPPFVCELHRKPEARPAIGSSVKLSGPRTDSEALAFFV